MSDDKFLNKYRIPSARAPWHGYDSGIYFITICTAGREHFFGEISVETLRATIVETRRITSLQTAEPKMQLSPIGQYTNDQFANVSTHYPYAEIPLFVIMPNHIHAIVMVDGKMVPYQRRVVTYEQFCNDENCQNIAYPDNCRNVAKINGNCNYVAKIDDNCRDAAKIDDNCRDAARHVSTIADMRKIANLQGWLSIVIGGLKSSITQFAHKNNIPFAWQTRFHDRIVRNQEELNRITLYIEQNVATWYENELLE